MSRQIKFRAWDKECNDMYPNIQNHIGNFDTAFGNMLNQSRYVIMQYTGLKDKNGVEIYEGDLLKDPQGNIGEVFYLAPTFAVRWKRKDGSWDTDTCFGYGEVIGNIHENPELLKETADVG